MEIERYGEGKKGMKFRSKRVKERMMKIGK
jgi:hypothetical protein